MKMSTALPSLTTSWGAGICVLISAFGSTGWGVACPSESPASRRIFSASPTFLPVTAGTVSLPSPTAIWIATSVPSSASSPAFGVCAITVPGGTFGSTFSLVPGASFSLASVITFSASKADFLPTTSGTVAFFGRKRNSSSASSSSSGTTIASHHGSHGFWRKTACVGRSGIAGGAAAPAPRLGILSWSRRRFCCLSCGPRTRGPRSCGSRRRTPCGPTDSPPWPSFGPVIFGPRTPFFANPLSAARPSSPPSSSSSSSASSSAGRSSSLTVPPFVSTSSRRSCGRPIHICFGGRTVIVVSIASPGATSTCAGLNAKAHSPSVSEPSNSTRDGAFALFSTRTW